MSRLTGFLAAAACLAIATPATAASFSDLYVFGDSLVDAGNVRALTFGTVPNPALGYFDGRFTNGLDYTDLISQRLFGDVTQASLTGGNNFAFGGARVVANGDPLPDLNVQLAAYQLRAGGVADPDALYVLNFGGNDIFALLNNDIGGATPSTYIANIISTYSGAVQTLNDIGARNIFITGIPNATVPLALDVDAQLQDALDGLTLDPGTTLYRYDYISFFTRVVANPKEFGLSGPLNTATTCLQARVPMPGIDCTGYFSFDGIHPTADIQRAQFIDIARTFGFVSVPEPASWAMMIVGFGLIGGALRRSRRAALMPG